MRTTTFVRPRSLTTRFSMPFKFCLYKQKRDKILPSGLFGTLKFLLAASLLMAFPTFAAQPVLDVRSTVGWFFPLSPIEGRWTFKSVDNICELAIEYWQDSGVVQITLTDDKSVLGTSFRALTQREETVPLFNDKTYLSYYSDFATAQDHMFLVEGVYEFTGLPGQKNTRKLLYLTRALLIQAQGPYRYVTYTASDRQGTEAKSCVF